MYCVVCACCDYRVVQAVLLTPLTFTRHRLSPLAVFTSGAHFSSHWNAATVNSQGLQLFH